MQRSDGPPRREIGIHRLRLRAGCLVVVLALMSIASACGSSVASSSVAATGSDPGVATSMSAVVAVLHKAGFDVTLAGPPTHVEDALLRQPGHHFSPSYFVLAGPKQAIGSVLIWKLSSAQEAKLAARVAVHTTDNGVAVPLELHTSYGPLVVQMTAVEQSAVHPLRALEKTLAAQFG